MDAIRLLATLVTALTLSTTVWAQYQPTQPVAEVARNSRGSQIPTRITNNPDFGIPFQMANTQGTVTEVQLHVSTDRGARWQMYQKQAPGANGFQFRASNDGEYWFAVRTIDRGQDPRDFNQAQLQPELKVVVDTQRPQLDIRVSVHQSGQATAEWQAQDQNLVSSSFRMQYQDQNERWQDVPVTTPDERDLRNRWQGQTQFWIRSRGQEATVRAEVVDRAGNSKLINKRISLAGGSNTNNQSFARDNQAGAVSQSWQDITSGIRNRLPTFLRDVQQTDDQFGATSARNWANLEPKSQFRDATNRNSVPTRTTRTQIRLQPLLVISATPRLINVANANRTQTSVTETTTTSHEIKASRTIQTATTLITNGSIIKETKIVRLTTDQQTIAASQIATRIAVLIAASTTVAGSKTNYNEATRDFLILNNRREVTSTDRLQVNELAVLAPVNKNACSNHESLRHRILNWFTTCMASTIGRSVLSSGSLATEDAHGKPTVPTRIDSRRWKSA